MLIGKSMIKQLVVCSLILISVAVGQTITAVNPPIPSGTNSKYYGAVQRLRSPLLQAQTLIVGLGNSASAPLFLDTETGTGACSPSISYTTLDAAVALYPTNLIFAPAAEGGTNNFTPKCVFSQAQANAVALTYGAQRYLPGDYVLVSSVYWQVSNNSYSSPSVDNTCLSPGTATLSGAGPVTDGPCTWTRIGANAPVQNGFCGPNYKCGPSGSDCYTANGSAAIVINIGSLGPCNTTQLYQSQPLAQELPIRAWKFQVLAAAITHYNSLGIGYIRVGDQGGELSPLGIGSGLWPNYGATANQQRAEYLSWVKILDTQIMADGPTMLVFSDMNNATPSQDPVYSDTEAQYAHDLNMNGIGTNGYQVNDVLDLQGVGSNNCAFPLVSSNCTSGDWAYNFHRYTTNAASQPFHHLLQTLTGSTPIDCAAGLTGPLSALPSGLTNCSGGFVGLIPFLVQLRTTGISSNIINVDYFEMYTNAPNIGSDPTYPAGDTLLTLNRAYGLGTNDDPTYLNTICIGCFTPTQLYQQTLANYLKIDIKCNAPTYGCAISTLNTIPLGIVPNMGGRLGVNTIGIDPVLGATYVRATDANEDPSLPNVSWQVTNGGDLDDKWINANDTLYGIIETGGRKKIKQFFPATKTVAPLYVSSFPSTNGWFFPYVFQFSSYDPALLYPINGTTIGSYTLDPPNYMTPPTFIPMFNFISGGGSTTNCLPSNFGTPTWTGSGGVGGGDSFFIAAWSSVNYHNGSSTGQNSGYWAAAYVPGKGCYAVNTSTGAIIADPGFAGGTGLTCGPTCTGTLSNAGTDLYTIHSLKPSLDVVGPHYMLVSRATCLSVSCAGGSSGGSTPYFIQIGTNIATYGAGTHNSGHAAEGATHFANIPGLPQAYTKPYSNPASETALISPLPSCTFGTLEQHMSWVQANQADNTPIVVSTTILRSEAPLDPPLCPWWQEWYAIDTNGDGLTKRLGRSYNTGTAVNFDASNAIGVTSFSGNLIALTSDWMNTLGNTSGGSTVIPNGPDWFSLRSYVLNYVINPSLSNTGNNSYIVITPGVSSSAEPTWSISCGTVGSTCNDGTVVWQNIGVPNGRSDVFLLIPGLGSSGGVVYPPSGLYGIIQ